MVEDDERWLVAPYGEVSWVRNAGAAGKLQLTRAGRCEQLANEEVGAEDAAPVLQRYLKRVPVVRPFFDVSPDSPLAEFDTEAPHHPVFRLTDTSDALGRSPGSHVRRPFDRAISRGRDRGGADATRSPARTPYSHSPAGVSASWLTREGSPNLL